MAKFEKGQSGNPSGRPKTILRIADEAAKHAQAAIDVLVAALADPNMQHRIAAAKELLDRGFGKAPQAIKHGEDPENPLPTSLTLRLIRPGDDT